MSESKKLLESIQNNINEDENVQPTSTEDLIARLAEYFNNAGMNTDEILIEVSKYINDSVFINMINDIEEHLDFDNK